MFFSCKMMEVSEFSRHFAAFNWEKVAFKQHKRHSGGLRAGTVELGYLHLVLHNELSRCAPLEG